MGSRCVLSHVQIELSSLKTLFSAIPNCNDPTTTQTILPTTTKVTTTSETTTTTMKTSTESVGGQLHKNTKYTLYNIYTI